MSTQSGQFVYDLPIVSTDLRPEETIHQICDSLIYLKRVSKDVFDRINDRIAESRNKLADINNRIDTARTKIDALKGVNKATKVFSSAKYPSANDDATYNRIYTSTMSVNMERKQVKINSMSAPPGDEILRDKLKSFDSPMHLNVRVKRVMDHGEGLGRLPQNVSSVSSLLLFNTSENPYKKYVILDPLGVVTKTRKEEVDEALPDAPSTIVQHEDMHRHTAENYSYMPGLGDVPEIAVPDFLPDLIGVADDLSYSQDLGPSIAPSVPTANIPELPEFTHDEALPAGPMSTQSENIPQPHEITIPPTAAPPPPPPPPPPPSVVPLPAPPPPPPPPTDIPEPPPSNSDVPKSAASLPSVDANKASLLESIRKAGGVGKVKLKSVKERKLAAKKQKQEEKDHGKRVASQAGGGDLMSDLTAKLLLRRKGISGTVKPDEKPTRDSLPNDSALNRVSALIPPPPDDRKRTRDDDEDWK